MPGSFFISDKHMNVLLARLNGATKSEIAIKFSLPKGTVSWIVSHWKKKGVDMRNTYRPTLYGICACGGHAFRATKNAPITAIVDVEDAHLLNGPLSAERYRKGRAYRVTGSNGVRLHRALMPNVRLVDHKNGNGADNRKVNLREADARINVVNTPDRKDWKNPTGRRGVYAQFRNGRKLYCARVHRKGRSIHLGYFKTVEEAHAVREAAALKEYGELPRQYVALVNNAPRYRE
jgi:hypothetical protein